MPRPERNTYHLNAPRIDEVLETHHLTHADVAAAVGCSRSYWSMLLNGHRRLSPRMRRSLRGHPLFESIPEDELWTRTPREPA